MQIDSPKQPLRQWFTSIHHHGLRPSQISCLTQISVPQASDFVMATKGQKEYTVDFAVPFSLYIHLCLFFDGSKPFKITIPINLHQFEFQ